MFDKNKFAQIIKNIKETYISQEEFSKKSEIGRTYLSQYMNMKLDEPPKPKILERLANSSNNITTYEELMNICGYTEETFEKVVFNIYLELKRYENFIHKNDSKSHYQIGDSIESFQNYLNDLTSCIEYKDVENIYLEDYYRKDYFLEDYSYVCGFMYLYDSFLKNLEINNYITIINHKFINWFSLDDIYINLNNLEGLELLSYNCSNISVKEQNISVFIEYIKEFSKFLNLSFLSDFDNNALTGIFKKKINPNIKNFDTLETIQEEFVEQTNQFFLCPVYGKISAGQPNWAEECLDGYLPIDPTLMNINSPDECFFLRVNGQSMNKIIKDGAYALIRKTDFVENGEIAVVLVNGFDATLKKFTKQGDVIVLEPMSDDPTITTQVYNKDTSIKVIGKYLGKFEINQ